MAPTPVQTRAIPVLQAGRDLFAQAQTGTGKTAAFAIPILEKVDAVLKRPQALVVVPTRELALQVTREFGAIGKYRKSHEVAIYAEKQNVDSIGQVYVEALEQDKVRALEELLRRYETDQVLVFRHTKRGVDDLEEKLRKRKHNVAAIHGDMTQRERERTLERFRAGDLHVLIATNVAARGLHIEDISHVVNYDLPEDAEVFTHRVGRTGRAGKLGVAVTFVGEWDFDAFDQLRAKAGVPFRREVLELYER